MVNPFDAFIGEARDTITLVITFVMVVMVLGAIGVAFGMQEFTNQIISSLSWGVLLVLAIPSMAIIYFIFWIFNQFLESNASFY